MKHKFIIIHVRDANCRKDKTENNTRSLNYLVIVEIGFKMWIQLSLLIDLYFTGEERIEINFWLREVDSNSQREVNERCKNKIDIRSHRFIHVVSTVRVTPISKPSSISNHSSRLHKASKQQNNKTTKRKRIVHVKGDIASGDEDCSFLGGMSVP